MKFLVQKNAEGMLLKQINGEKEYQEIQLRDGDIVETGHDPYLLFRVDSIKEEFYTKKV